MRTTRLLAPLVLVAALMLAGCSDDPAEFDSSGGGGTGAQADDGGADQDDSQATVSEIDPTDVIAEYTVDLPPGADAPEGSTLTVGIHSLQVIDDVMLLELYFTPDIAGDDAGEWSLYKLNGSNRSFWPVLTDRSNLKQYQLLTDAELGAVRWASDSVYTTTTDGQTVLWWGYYAAPQDDIDSVTIQVTDTHPVVDDVPIER